MQSDGKKEIWDFYPLPGDPTLEERIKLMEEAKVEQTKTDDDFARSVLVDFKNKGLI